MTAPITCFSVQLYAAAANGTTESPYQEAKIDKACYCEKQKEKFFDDGPAINKERQTQEVDHGPYQYYKSDDAPAFFKAIDCVNFIIHNAYALCG
jgi:hypothetical protein